MRKEMPHGEAVRHLLMQNPQGCVLIKENAKRMSAIISSCSFPPTTRAMRMSFDLWNDPDMRAVRAEDYARFMKDPVHPTREGYDLWWGPKFAAYLA